MARNQYPGTCYRCGGHVAAGAGHFERMGAAQRKKWNIPFDLSDLRYGSRWLTQHAECAITYRGTDIHYIYNPDPELTPAFDRQHTEEYLSGWEKTDGEA